MNDNKEEELWRPVSIEEIKDKYEVSNKGNVKNKRTGLILAKVKHVGYLRVKMSKCVNKVTKYYPMLIHRLVALAFIENDNPSIKTYVNHKDCNKHNNCVDNLEWVSPKGNVDHAIKAGVKKSLERPIKITDSNGDIFTYRSCKIAAIEANINGRTIREALRTGYKPFGWIIEYANDSDKKTEIDLSSFEELKNYPGYLINRNGDVYGIKSKRLQKHQFNEAGYIIVYLAKERKKEYLHKILAVQYIPNPDEKMYVNHKDHNKANFALDNLEWVTQEENTNKYFEMKRIRSALEEIEQEENTDDSKEEQSDQ